MQETAVSNEYLISLIKERPVLWDKTQFIYKDKAATKIAWDEVCAAVVPNYEDLDEKDQFAIGKEVVRKWTNLRDSYIKSRKVFQNQKPKGIGGLKIIRRKYIYSDQMEFLEKLYGPKDADKSTGDPSGVFVKEEDVKKEVTSASQIKPVFKRGSLFKQSKLENILANLNNKRSDEEEMKTTPDLDRKELFNFPEDFERKKPNIHISFIESVLPHLEKFDDSEVLKFQMGVLNLISSIYEQKRIVSQTSSYPNQPFMLAMQPSQFGQQLPYTPHPPSAHFNPQTSQFGFTPSQYQTLPLPAPPQQSTRKRKKCPAPSESKKKADKKLKVEQQSTPTLPLPLPVAEEEDELPSSGSDDSSNCAMDTFPV